MPLLTHVLHDYVTLVFPWVLHMVEISQDGYFLQKLSLFFQLQRQFLSTFGIEPPPTIDFSGQSCRRQSVKLILSTISTFYIALFSEKCNRT